MRHFGAATVGFIELDDNTRKLIYGVDPDGKELIFTDDPVASEDEDARYIPNSCKYVIVLHRADVDRDDAPLPHAAGFADHLTGLHAR